MTVEGVALALVALICVDTWIAELRSVAGGSMAPGLAGASLHIECQDCGYAFRFGTVDQHGSPNIVCPNCGSADNPASSARQVSGDRILIARPLWPGSQLRRWQLLTFRSPEAASEVALKRVGR